MIGRHWDIALAICFSFMVAGLDVADELPQPENLTLSRKPDHFSVTAEWSKPSGLDADCTVNYTVELYLEKCPPSSTALSSYTDKRQTMSLEYNFDAPNQREICVVVQTNPKQCGNKTPSKPVYKSISPPPALVKNFTCVYYARMKMNCTWSVISDSSGLQLFYKRKDSESLKPCISYITSEHMKTGCHLDDIDISTHDTFFKISGTDSETVNTFIIEQRNSVKAEPPKLNISRRAEQLFLSSSTPDFSPKCWKYKFNYSKCDEKKEVVSDEETIRLEYDAACEYTAQVKTIFTPNCGRETESEISESVSYDGKIDPYSHVKVAMIVIPLMVSLCVITALVLFRRYKDIILPSIPEPSLLFKDMLNSNNDGGQSKSLYVPITEVVEGDIRLEPKSTSLHPKP